MHYFYGANEMDRKFQTSPLTCIFHVTRPYHCSPPCRSLFYSCVVSNSVALRERRQAHDDTFSCVSFRKTENRRRRRQRREFRKAVYIKSQRNYRKAETASAALRKKRKKKEYAAEV